VNLCVIFRESLRNNFKPASFPNKQTPKALQKPLHTFRFQEKPPVHLYSDSRKDAKAQSFLFHADFADLSRL
jgi:hypothetical protein